MRTIIHATTLTVLASVAAAQQPVTKDAPAGPREQPPALAPARDFKLPAPTRLTLPNGMRVALVPFGTIPKATVRLYVRTGNIDERSDQTWLADLTGDLMVEGTATRTARQIAEETAAMGGSLGIGVGTDQTNIGGEVLGERAPDMVRLVADVVRHPAFPASELPRLKANRLRSLAVQRSQAQTLASERFAQVMYGDHPYGRFYPTEAQLQGYTVDEVKAFHAANYGAARATLYVVGVYDRAAVERAVREAFGDWAAGAPPTKNPPTPVAKRSVALIDRPDAVQSTIIVGLPVPDPSNPDYTKLVVTDALLGGAFGSRITSNIREQKGYTYSPFSFINTHVGDAYWAEQADVTTNVTGASLTEIFKEVDRLQAEAPPAQELGGIKNNLAGVFVLQNGSRAGITSQLQFVNLNGLGEDYLTGYVKRVLAVTPEDVQQTARKYLDKSKMTLVVVGDKKTVEAQLAPFVPTVP
ncbi:peptidase M16 domain protein [Gemmatirosa kalamazoonensis]|uniref:Peptidase M16 domain protein n=1 Tax=Gemmatirosa kalamazoonensis TaxID=861299 RepID=W0RDB2_9BACT|nr:pitrilysin family protein [Gemmatirosa kalamazoonensis]AHG88300.1 peptidase M16 domain protein [Gemmatirosa kalamazoonensis]